MECKGCKYFYTEFFNHYFNYCKKIDKYILEIDFKCFVKKPLTKYEKIKLNMSNFFTGKSKLNK